MHVRQTIKSLAAALVVASASWTQAGIISVNFAEQANSDATTVASDESAGVVAAAQWNNFFVSGSGGINGSLTDVVDDVGDVAGGFQVAFTAGNTFRTSTSLTSADDPDQRMLNAYLAGSTITITLTEVPYEVYDLYVYVGANAGGRRSQVTVGDTTYFYSTIAGSYNGGDYVQATQTVFSDPPPAANYVLFTGLTESTISFVRQNAPGFNDNSGVLGFQVVEVPEPGTLALTGLSGLLLLRRWHA